MPSYVLKLIKNYDDKANSLASGLAIRPLTAAEILAHLEDFGIDSTLAHGKVKQMSGGQRCRRAAILGCLFWQILCQQPLGRGGGMHDGMTRTLTYCARSPTHLLRSY